MTADAKVGLPGAVKLTKWSKEPDVMALKEDLQVAKSAHDSHVINVNRWNDLRNVTGKARPKTLKNRSSVQPKVIRRQAEWRYSALSEAFLSTDDLYDVDPVTFEDTYAAEQNELILNWQFRTKIDRVSFIDKYVRTGVDEGTIIVRLGWNRITRMKPVKIPVFSYLEATEEEAAQLQQALALREENPNGFESLPAEIHAAVDYFDETGMATSAQVVGYEDSQEEKIVENTPTLDILKPENVYIDPSCEGDIDKAGFAVISFTTSKAELLKDGRYKNLNAVNWGGNTVLGEPDHKTETPDDANFQDELRKKVVAYEYWGFYDIDGTGELQPIVATWIGDVMIRMEKNPFPDKKIPLVVVPYLPVRNQLTGEPDAEILEDNQAIIGATTRGMIDLLGRSANSQQGMAKGFLDATNRRRFDRGEDYEFNPNNVPQQAVHQHVYPEIPNSALTMINYQNQDAEALSGVKSFSGGLSGEAYGEVATGIKGMLDAAAKREMNILRRLAAGVQKIGAKIIAMNGVFLSEEEVIRVTNKKFVTVRREDLAGNFDLKVDIATAEVDEAKAQDLGFMLQTMGPEMDPAMSRMILADIADLKRMPALAQKIRTYKPEPDPYEEQVKGLELRKLQAEVDKLESEVVKNRALAEKAESEADQNNLDYVEQESGTQHERAMDRQTAQAASNQDLEVTKALLKERKPETKAPDIEAAVGYNQLSDPTRTVHRY